MDHTGSMPATPVGATQRHTLGAADRKYYVCIGINCSPAHNFIFVSGVYGHLQYSANMLLLVGT